VRPCPTCQCFVPVAAHQCPRCSAALEPIEVHEEAVTESRDLVLIGALSGTSNGMESNGDAANGRSPLAGSARDARSDIVTRSGLARVMLPPIDGPAGRPRRPTLPKLPQPFAPDPLVLAVFLGIPIVESDEPEVVDRAEAEIVDAPAEVETPDDTADETPDLTPETFSALLGIPREDLLPAKPPVAPAPTRAPEPPPALVAVPVVTTGVRTEALVKPGRRRLFTRHDPFARTTTRRERILTRICLLLVLVVAGTVIVLRLPVASRPELSSIIVGDGLTSPVTRIDDEVRIQARQHLRDTLTVAEEVYPTRNTYADATPDVLNDSLPDLSFVSGTRVSRRLGEISVAGSAELIVLAEAGDNGECVFARIDGSEQPETATLPNGNPCRASAPPDDGWTALGMD